MVLTVNPHLSTRTSRIYQGDIGDVLSTDSGHPVYSVNRVKNFLKGSGQVSEFMENQFSQVVCIRMGQTTYHNPGESDRRERMKSRDLLATTLSLKALDSKGGSQSLRLREYDSPGAHLLQTTALSFGDRDTGGISGKYFGENPIYADSAILTSLKKSLTGADDTVTYVHPDCMFSTFDGETLLLNISDLANYEWMFGSGRRIMEELVKQPGYQELHKQQVALHALERRANVFRTNSRSLNEATLGILGASTEEIDTAFGTINTAVEGELHSHLAQYDDDAARFAETQIDNRDLFRFLQSI
tara:strand:+ start:124 stop:1026 length:903 start_codon:yes stop_codon:yes gene_type:complete